MDNHSYHNENLEEAELGQLHAIHLNMNALAAVQRNLELQAKQESLSHCEDCGEPIPELRRKAIKGCRRCVYCQEQSERG